MELPGAVQQRLGRNATDVQASTAEGQRALLVGVFLDAGSGEAQLRRLEGRYVAARARTNHYHVEFLSHESFLLESNRTVTCGGRRGTNPVISARGRSTAR